MRMTVGELKFLIKNYDDDVVVVLDIENACFRDVVNDINIEEGQFILTTSETGCGEFYSHNDAIDHMPNNTFHKPVDAIRLY